VILSLMFKHREIKIVSRFGSHINWTQPIGFAPA